MPLLKKKPQLWRSLAFLPVALIGTFLGFAILEMATEMFFAALPGGILIGIGLALLVCGIPRITLPKVKLPQVHPQVKPWLWFPVTALFTGILYFALGLALMPLGLEPVTLVFVTLGSAFVLAGTGAYFLTGFPNLYKQPRDLWARVPTDKRPHFFWPLSLLFIAALFVGIGVGLSQTTLPLEWLPLLTLATAVPAGCALAYLLVGFPKPKRPVREFMPKVPARVRPALFGVSFLLLGPVFGFPVGYLLSANLPRLPTVLLFPLALLVGYTLAFVAAALMWGLPSRWEKEGVKVGIPEASRGFLFVPVAVLVTTLVVLMFAAAGLDLGIGTLAGAPVGLAAGLVASGTARTLRERARSGTLMEEFPEKFKLLVIVSVWGLVGGAVFFALGMAGILPPWNLFAGVSIGLAVAILMVEGSALRYYLDERRAERDRRRRLKALRAERLGHAKPAREKQVTLQPTVPAGTEAAPKEARKGFALPFLRRRK